MAKYEPASARGPGACTLDEFDGFVARANSAPTLTELRQALIDFLKPCGIQMMSYHHLPPPGAEDYTAQVTVATYGFPSEWVSRYEAEFVDIDPIPKRALSAIHSFFWSDAVHFEGLSKDERRYLKELQDAQIGDGLAIPVFGPLGRSGYVGLGFGVDGEKPDSHAISMIQSACQLGHQQYCKMLFAQRAVADGSLSPRETEILRWVSRGKSNAVIAEILEISGHTVDTHLRRTFSKLRVQDRVTAALRGAALGFL